MNDFTSFFPIVSNLGAVGLIFWLVWRTINTTIPTLVSSFEESQKQARIDFRESLKEQRKEHGEQLEEHREFYADQVKLCREHATKAFETMAVKRTA